MQVTVKAVKKDNTAFCDTEEKWHNMGFKQVLPPGVTRGAVVELEEATNAKGYTNITTIKLVEAGSAAPSTAPVKGAKFSREELIIRQNALTNAVNYSGPDVTPEGVIEIMEQFAAAVFNGSEKQAPAPAPVQAGSDAPY